MGIRRKTAAVTARVALLAGLLVLAAAGCAALPGGDDEAPGVDAAADVPRGRPAVDGGSKPVVSGTFDTPLVAGGRVEIAVLDLKVRGRLATLTVRLTPRLPAGVPSRTTSPFRLNGSNGLGTSLIDPINLKRYVVVKDSGGKELQSHDIFTNIANNQPAALSYTFAAPPENVKAVDVQYGSWPTFRNIPVQR
jgi:hypothetical protein